MPKGIYDPARRPRGDKHHSFKHGRYINEKRSETAKEERRLAQRRYYAAHPGRRVEQLRRYRETHREKIRADSYEYARRPEVRARLNAKRNTPEGKAKRRMENQRARAKNPELYRWRWIKAKYGLTKHDYEAMLQSQGGVCKICSAPPTGSGVGRILEIDHCHKTNIVRGLVCRRCNTAISYLETDPLLLSKMVVYLKATHIHVEVA